MDHTFLESLLQDTEKGSVCSVIWGEGPQRRTKLKKWLSACLEGRSEAFFKKRSTKVCANMIVLDKDRLELRYSGVPFRHWPRCSRRKVLPEAAVQVT